MKSHLPGCNVASLFDAGVLLALFELYTGPERMHKEVHVSEPSPTNSQNPPCRHIQKPPLTPRPVTSLRSNHDADFNLMDPFACFRLSADGIVQFWASGFFHLTLSLGVRHAVGVMGARLSLFLLHRISYALSILLLVRM